MTLSDSNIIRTAIVVDYFDGEFHSSCHLDDWNGMTLGEAKTAVAELGWKPCGETLNAVQCKGKRRPRVKRVLNLCV